MKHLLLSLVIFVSSLAYSGPGYQYCNNERDYKVHMEFHRMRVVMLAVFMYYSDVSLFKGVDEHTLVEFIGNEHDSSKLDLNSLVARRLMQFYGTPYEKRDDANKEELRALVNYINKTDEQRRDKYFKRKKITNPRVIDNYVALETIGDLIDRSYDPVAREEFGKEMYPASQSPRIAATYMPLVKPFEIDGRENYKKLTKGFEFPGGDPSGIEDCLVFIAKGRMHLRLESIRFLKQQPGITVRATQKGTSAERTAFPRVFGDMPAL